MAFKELYFLKGGERYWTVDGWTKGLVLNRNNKIAPAYQIKNIDDKKYLILEWKSGNYCFGGKITWYVFGKPRENQCQK